MNQNKETEPVPDNSTGSDVFAQLGEAMAGDAGNGPAEQTDKKSPLNLSRRSLLAGGIALGALAATGGWSLLGVLEPSGCVANPFNQAPKKPENVGTVKSAFKGLPEGVGSDLDLCCVLEPADWNSAGNWQTDGENELDITEGTYGAYPLTTAFMTADGDIWACGDYQEVEIKRGEETPLEFEYALADPVLYDVEEARGIAENSFEGEAAEAALAAFTAKRAAAMAERGMTEDDLLPKDAAPAALSLEDAQAAIANPEQTDPEDTGFEVVEAGEGWEETMAGVDLPFDPEPYEGDD